MEPSAEANSRNVRIAAGLFFFVCVPLSLWETSVQSKIFVLQDPVATAGNLLANEFNFRTSIVSHFIGTVAFAVMVLLFYNLLRPVSKPLARFMAVSIIAQLAIVFVLEALNVTALMTLKAEARPTFDVARQQETAYFLLRLYRLAYGPNKIIFALFFIPLGILVFRSGFAPRIIGILLIAGGIGYVADTCFYILLQRADYRVVSSIKLFSSGTYSLALLWFLIRGARNPSTQPK